MTPILLSWESGGQCPAKVIPLLAQYRTIPANLFSWKELELLRVSIHFSMPYFARKQFIMSWHLPVSRNWRSCSLGELQRVEHNRCHHLIKVSTAVAHPCMHAHMYIPYSRVVTPPSLLRPPPPPLFSAKLLLRVTFCSLIRPPTYTCTHVFGLLLPQCLL